jgi:hypothetical protein
MSNPTVVQESAIHLYSTKPYHFSISRISSKTARHHLENVLVKDLTSTILVYDVTIISVAMIVF